MGVFPLIFFVISFCLVVNLEARTWTSLDGKIIEADLVKADDGKVTLKRSDGKTFTLAANKLSDADNKLIPKPVPGRSDQVQYDKEGRVRTSAELVKKLLSMSKDQQRIYLKWKEEVQLKARPDFRYSTKRFPFAHRAMDAIKKGQRPERP